MLTDIAFFRCVRELTASYRVLRDTFFTALNHREKVKRLNENCLKLWKYFFSSFQRKKEKKIFFSTSKNVMVKIRNKKRFSRTRRSFFNDMLKPKVWRHLITIKQLTTENGRVRRAGKRWIWMWLPQQYAAVQEAMLKQNSIFTVKILSHYRSVRLCLLPNETYSLPL